MSLNLARLDLALCSSRPSGEGGGGGEPEEVLFYDLEHGVYRIDDNIVDLGGSFVENLDWSDWDPSTVVENVGLVGTARPTFSDAAGVLLLAGATYSIEFTTSGNGNITLDVTDLPDSNDEYKIRVVRTDDEAALIAEANGSQDSAFAACVNGAHTIVATITSTGVSVALDDGEVLSHAATQSVVPTHVVLGVNGNMTVTSITAVTVTA